MNTKSVLCAPFSALCFGLVTIMTSRAIRSRKSRSVWTQSRRRSRTIPGWPQPETDRKWTSAWLDSLRCCKMRSKGSKTWRRPEVTDIRAVRVQSRKWRRWSTRAKSRTSSRKSLPNQTAPSGRQKFGKGKISRKPKVAKWRPCWLSHFPSQFDSRRFLRREFFSVFRFHEP